ncbi:glucoamylase family protein [Longimicrobium sp.]|uniref:glucoamylase family protein n=1 Tax=Longimicrobium sp. TaxID=2029185 RepID=UPI002E31B994|nr:glucoamylase family protein [Longimicrobium sp.]HEX6042797.1 glucoamylase family protein [Longimicrobium sp.]
MRLISAVLVSSVLASAGCAAAAGPSASPAMPAVPSAAAQEAFLDTLQERTFRWFWETTNPRNGLVPDRWPTKSFSSVASVGFGLTAYAVGVERGWVSRGNAADRTLTTLRFFWNAPQGPAPVGMTGHKGFYYHFLDMETGHRFERVELSTIDTGLLMLGVLAAAEYFDGPDPREAEIRALADSLYRRVDWAWAATPRPPLVSMGWHPEDGFIPHDYKGYSEAMFLYVLALGSPTHPIQPAAWNAFTSTYVWADFQGYPQVNFPPLFGHQYSHAWIDFRGIRDAYMRDKGLDYFENSRRATYAQRQYAIANPMGWDGYGPNLWGLTAADGPKDTTLAINGRQRTFWTYRARGVSADFVEDDGTLVPTAAGGSVAFAPEIAIPALMSMRRTYGDNLFQRYGFLDSFNPTLKQPMPLQHGRIVPGVGWFDGDYLGIDQGPIVLMIENHRSDLVWRLMRENEHVVRGLCRAGFTGGWLEGRCG